jgi:hypothetical protein
MLGLIWSQTSQIVVFDRVELIGTGTKQVIEPPSSCPGSRVTLYNDRCELSTVYTYSNIIWTGNS